MLEKKDIDKDANKAFIIILVVAIVAFFAMAFYVFYRASVIAGTPVPAPTVKAASQVPVNIVAVKVADGQVYFGKLTDKTLCNFYIIQLSKNSAGQAVPQLVKPDNLYGGAGCIVFREDILWTEELKPGTPAYQQIIK